MLEIEPFAAEHVDAAAELLAARHSQHRATEPLLPADVDFRKQIVTDWDPETAGAFAWRDGEPVGYVVGRPNPKLGFRVGIGGHAVHGEVEVVRDLYGAVAGSWLEAGYPHHEAFVPASDTDLIDAWFRLDFGAGAVLGMRETSSEAEFDAGALIRPGTDGDLAGAAALDAAMDRAMEPSPSFSHVRYDDDEYLEDWRDTWNEPQSTHFVAERDGRLVGHLLLYRRPPDLRVPDGSIDLAAASTLPDVRGSGIGRALTQHAINWAHEQGIPTMTIDWRMTNLFASRFWPRRGFRPTFLRLHRNLS
jgi:ribosomal protein S18 acetylase RimI-like enzyme